MYSTKKTSHRILIALILGMLTWYVFATTDVSDTLEAAIIAPHAIAENN